HEMVKASWAPAQSPVSPLTSGGEERKSGTRQFPRDLSCSTSPPPRGCARAGAADPATRDPTLRERHVKAADAAGKRWNSEEDSVDRRRGDRVRGGRRRRRHRLRD